jgi:hypothetical protein
MTGLLLAVGMAAYGAGIGMEGGRVALDLGQVVPGHPVIWPGSSQLSVFADTPWHLSVRAEADLSDREGRCIPADRLSWSLADDAGTWSAWHPLKLQEQQVLADKLPTGSEGRQLALGYRFCGSWDDPLGGPFSTTIQVSLVAGIELVPAYVWPQPYVVGDGALRITYWAGGVAGTPSFPTCLLIRDAQGLLVAEIKGSATPETWVSTEWSGQASDGRAVAPGSYAYAVVDERGTPLAQGLLQVVDSLATGIHGEVSGEVWADGQQVAGATVMLLTGARRLIGSTVTDSAGEFVFDGLEAGTYVLEVSYPGYLPWTGELFRLDTTKPRHQEAVYLEANNALFVVASAHALRGETEPTAQDPHRLVPGEVVQVRGHVYNSGTRHLRNVVVKTHWPGSLQPLSGDGFSVSLLRIPELAPGQSVSLRFAAVCGWAATGASTDIQTIVVQAQAWAVRGTNDDLELVQSPPRCLPVSVRSDESTPGGFLAFFAFWDSDGNGRFSPQEAPAAGVRLRVGKELPTTTDQDGWLVQRVVPGPVAVYQPRDAEGASEHPVLAATVRSGEVLVFQLALASDGMISLADGQASQAVFGWNHWQGGPLWQGAGDLVVAQEDWSWRWSLPTRVEVVRHGDQDQGLSEQRWLVDASISRPLLAWSYSIGGEPAPGGRSDRLSFSSALGRQPAVFRKEWPAEGTGPYQIGVPVHAVHDVKITHGTQVVKLGEAEYTWGPGGQLWLARPPQALVGYKLEGPVLIAADYVPGDAQGEVLGVPILGIVARGRPRCEGPGSELVEEFGLNWKLPDPSAEGRHPLWRVSWERRLPDCRFYWEGGSLASPGGDPVGELIEAFDSPRLQPLPMADSESVWPPYARVEQQQQRGAWLVSTQHERRSLQRRQQVTLSRKLSTAVMGRLGLQLTRWAEPSVGDGGQASLVMQVGQRRGDWQWCLNQRVTLLEAGSCLPEDEAYDERFGVDGGSLTLSYMNSTVIRPQLGLHVDTRSGKARAEFDQVMSLGSAVQASVGGITHQGGVAPRARLKWRRVDVGLRTLPQEHDPGIQVDVATEGRRWTATWRGVYALPRMVQQLQLCYTKSLGVGSLLSAVLRSKAAQPEGTLLWEADAAWSGEVVRLGVPWQASLQLQCSYSSLGSEEAWASYAAAGGSLRRLLNERTAVAIGGTWPYLVTHHKVERKKECWAAFERRLGVWDSQALWGSLELRCGGGQVRPGIHFALR